MAPIKRRLTQRVWNTQATNESKKHESWGKEWDTHPTTRTQTQHNHKDKPQQRYFEKLGEPCANVHHQIQVLHQHTRNRGHLKNEEVNLETVRSVWVCDRANLRSIWSIPGGFFQVARSCDSFNQKGKPFCTSSRNFADTRSNTHTHTHTPHAHTHTRVHTHHHQFGLNKRKEMTLISINLWNKGCLYIKDIQTNAHTSHAKIRTKSYTNTTTYWYRFACLGHRRCNFWICYLGLYRYEGSRLWKYLILSERIAGKIAYQCMLEIAWDWLFLRNFQELECVCVCVCVYTKLFRLKQWLRCKDWNTTTQHTYINNDRVFSFAVDDNADLILLKWMYLSIYVSFSEGELCSIFPGLRFAS